MIWVMSGSLLGGVGLFLLGMRLMTDGLKFAAGNSLRSILERSTCTRLRGIFSGALITALIQASGAVTVAVIGFVNAGLMNLSHAVAIIYGSNIGTTMTAWLVTLVGFDINIKAFAVPAVGVGMLFRLLRPDSRFAALGDVLAGFGVFFIGLDVLKTTFSGLSASIDIASFAGEGFAAMGVFVGIGFLLTLLMQSSSASIAIILTAATGGVVPISDAAAAVIGANVGTTSTAAIAVLGASPDAKRLAAAHVIFNLVTGCVAFIVLPNLLQLLYSLDDFLGIEKTPATILAIFHTAFNFLGVLLLYPMTNALVSYLEKRFRTREEDEAIPKYLSKNALQTPVLAIQAVAMELNRVGEIARKMARGSLSLEGGPTIRLRADKIIVDRLIIAVEDFSSRLQRSNLPAELHNHMPDCLRVIGYYSAVAELSVEIAELLKEDYSIEKFPVLAELVASFKSDAVKILTLSDSGAEDFDSELCHSKIEELKTAFKNLKLKMLQTASRDGLQVSATVHFLEVLSRIRRTAEQAEKGARYLAGVRSLEILQGAYPETN